MTYLIEKDRAVRRASGTVLSRLANHATALGLVAAISACAYGVYVFSGLLAHAQTSGSQPGMGVYAPAAIYRDKLDVPHIRAANLHDAFLAEGFAQASDRLFQMDLFRRFIYGELAEVLGPIQLSSDEALRTLDIREVAARQWMSLSAEDRAALAAFSTGVNDAIRTQPLPVEFRLLLYRPAPWTPRDCLAVTLAMSISLEDTPDNVLERDALWRALTRAQYAAALPLSDPRYDVDAAAVPAGITQSIASFHAGTLGAAPAFGSNVWAAGGVRASGSALLANDPHLSVGLPGIFYEIELQAPGLHVAGVTVAGIPGVVLGHNQRLAWGTSNAMVSTMTLFRPAALNAENWKTEVFRVRFSPNVRKRYYRARYEFGYRNGPLSPMVLVRWLPYSSPCSALTTVFGLNRAASIPQALRVLSHYCGPPQNFMLAGPYGQVAYQLAGQIPNDPAWGRYVHGAADLRVQYVPIPFAELPHAGPSSSAVLVSANNKMYGRRYAYRLSPMFAPPYRARRIADLLHQRSTYDTAYFARMQLDTVSPADAEFAHRLASYARRRGMLPISSIELLRQWGGNVDGSSRAATLAYRLRMRVQRQSSSPYVALDGFRQAKPPQAVIDAVTDPSLEASTISRWGVAGAVRLFHPFGTIGFPFLNGATLPGDGDDYTIHVQTAQLAQNFRAVWHIGRWDSGGLSMPTGESGEIGSPHYDDRYRSWIRGILQPLPFSDSAVRAAARSLLLLEQ